VFSKNFALSLPGMTQAQTITLYQPLLVTIAQGFVRCQQDAEDIVQEVFLKWLSAEQTKIENTKAYLIRAVTNSCLNHLNSFRKKKQEYLDSIHFDEFIHRIKENNLAHLDLPVDLNRAFKLMHAKLEPIERAVFLMKDVFDFDYNTIQQTLNKKQENCRQILCRARKKLSESTTHLSFEMPEVSKMLQSFQEACTLANAEKFVQELKADVVSALTTKKA
jgi:RNA polymerase sigma factor (sigma-70 family)